jgi:preprotein translocase subunit YajC
MTTHTLLALFAPSGQDAGGGLLVLMGQLVLFFGIIYFLLIRPQRRQQEQQRQLLASLQRGDHIVTTGGVVGEVIHIKDDQVTIRSGESRMIVVRSGIANITNRTAPVETKAEVKKAEVKAK